MPDTKRPPSQNQRGRRRRGPRSQAEAPPLPITDSDILKQVSLPLDKARFVVFDIETTGGNPEKNGITEIFAVRFSGGLTAKPTETFYSMVNPGVSIPPIVRRMTGITNAMVKDAPPIGKVMPGFVEFIGNDILVSHNTIGDMKFLRYFSEKTCKRPINNFYLCTHLLVEKLAPESPDKSLKGLSKHFRLPSGDLHRAEADAYLTLELFKVLISRLLDRTVKTAEGAIRLQGDMESAARLGWGVRAEAVQGLPQGVGVYYLYDQERRLLFASSAQSLAREVAKLQRHVQVPRSLLRLVLRSYDLQVDRFPNLLAAMLKECETSLGAHIGFSAIDWHQRFLPCLLIGDSAEGIRVHIGSVCEGTRYALGPLTDRKQAHLWLDDIASALGLKQGRHGLVIPTAQPQETAAAIAAYFQGRASQEIKNSGGMLGALKLLFKPNDRKASRDRINLLRKLQSAIKNPPQLLSLLDECGVIIVPDDVTGSWQLHTIVASRPRSETSIKGDWEAKLHQAGFGRRIVEKIQKDVRNHRANPLAALEAAKVNATIWWLHTNYQRKEGTFVSLVDLEAWLQKQPQTQTKTADQPPS